MEAERKRLNPPWIPWAVAGLALAGMLGAGALAFRTLGAPPPEEKKADEPGLAPVHDRKPPSHFGFPTYPGAFEFHSLEAGKEHGSTSYRLKRGTAAGVAAFYRRKLEGMRWRLEGQSPIAEQPGGASNPQVPRVTGFRQVWTREGESRRLSVLALDFPQRTSAVQVSLSWSPRAGAGR
jgi:hypothetical protein